MNQAVVLKIIVGCDAKYAELVAAEIRAKKQVPSVDEAYELALRRAFGCIACLVVMDKERIKFKGEGPLSERFRETFDEPMINPRGQDLKVHFVEAVDL